MSQIKKSPFFAQASLMIECLPEVFAENCFALKGGTAINLFYSDIPRLSVDIDLTYLPNEPFEESQANISNALERIARRLEKKHSKCRVLRTKWNKTSITMKIIMHFGGVSVVIEPNMVIRGSIETPIDRDLSAGAQNIFSKEVTVRCLSKKEIYAGKFCAALDRQHPRDLFDVVQFFKNEEFDEQQKDLFLVYLMSTSRPIHEILFSTPKDLKLVYEREFQMMTEKTVPLAELLDARTRMISTIHSNLNSKDKEFLLSFSAGNPKWELFRFPQAADFSGVTWKLHNIQLPRDSNPAKLKQQLSEFSSKLASI